LNLGGKRDCSCAFNPRASSFDHLVFGEKVEKDVGGEKKRGAKSARQPEMVRIECISPLLIHAAEISLTASKETATERAKK